MKIKRITLRNFRQFAGEVEVPLSPDVGKPITVIYGTNGGGKTTLLSAVYWAFHGQIPYIAASDLVANMDAFESLPEGEVLPVSVSLDLEDKGYHFSITRTRNVEKLNGQESHQSSDNLTFIGADGVSVTPPQLEINRRFPPNLAKFFFVPGESIDKFFQNSSLPELVENIKSISEIGAYESAVILADQVEARLLRDLSESSSNPRLRAAKDAISALAEEQKELEKGHREVSERLDSLKEEAAKKQALVGKPEDVDRIFEAKLAFDEKITQAKLDLSKLDGELLGLVGTSGHLAFTESLEENVHAAFQDLGLRNGGQASFLSPDGLRNLSNGAVCVCGNHIGDSERAQILALASANENASMSEKAHEITTYLSGAFSFDVFVNEYKGLLNTREHMVREIRNLELERDAEFANGLAGNPSQEIYIEIGRIRGEIASAEVDLAAIDAKLFTNSEKSATANKKLNSEIERGSNQEVIERQRGSLAKIKASLQESLENHRLEFMNELHSELSKLMSEFVFSPVVIDLHENFEFNLLRPDGKTPFGEAGGQDKAKAIAMVMALYRIAARKAKEGLALDDEAPAEFPLLIDSAFGELGGELRRRVGVELSKSGSQCVLLVSDTQLIGLTDGLSPEALGKSILLHSYVKGQGQDVVEPAINGQKVTWLSFNSDAIKTKIEVLS